MSGLDERILWDCTPRQLVARWHFVQRFERTREAREISSGAMAARGEAKDLKRHLAELQKDLP